MLGGINGTEPSLRETIMSYVAGGLFAIAWWLWIDAHAFSAKFELTDVHVTFPIYLPGIASTIALIMYKSSSCNSLRFQVTISFMGRFSRFKLGSLRRYNQTK